MKLTTYFHLVQSLRMCGAIPPFPCFHSMMLSQAQGKLYLCHIQHTSESFMLLFNIDQGLFTECLNQLGHDACSVLGFRMHGALPPFPYALL